MNRKFARLATVVTGLATLGIFTASTPAQAQFDVPDLNEVKEEAEKAGRQAGREAREFGQEAERTLRSDEFQENAVQCSKEGLRDAAARGITTRDPVSSTYYGVAGATRCNLREAR